MDEIKTLTGLVDKEQLKDILSVFARAIKTNEEKITKLTTDFTDFQMSMLPEGEDDYIVEDETTEEEVNETIEQEEDEEETSIAEGTYSEETDAEYPMTE